MTPSFSENLRLVLKMLSMSAARLASELGTDKSVVSRWLNGSVRPSAHNLSRLSALVSTRIEGFTALDWERDPRSLAGLFGADPTAIPAMRAAPPGLPLIMMDQMIAAVSVRGAAHEGFFRCTRPHPRMPGRFLREYAMVRRDEIGLLRVNLGSVESKAEGWLMPLHGFIYCIAAEVKSGALQFGLFNGSGASRLDVFDGLTLLPGVDLGRAPTATAMICERVGELSGERDADDQRFAELSSQNPLAPEGAVPEHIVKHLARDFGPLQLAAGGDWLLNSSLIRSLTRGPDYERPSGPSGTNGSGA